MLPSTTALRRKRPRPSLRETLMALYHFSAKMLSRASRNTVGAIAYRAGCKLYDERTGESFDYRHKAVEHVELLLPKDAPAWAVDIQKLIVADRQKGVQALCNIVESPEKRIDSQVWREFEFALHRELTKEQNMALAREFVQDQICFRGMAAQLNFHFDVDKKTGDETPHCHATMTMRRLEEDGLSPKKEEAWNKKELLLDLRIKWEEYSNFHLKFNGYDIRIDHRSNKDRGIGLEPQPKLGKGILEQERRAKYKALQEQNKERGLESNTDPHATEKGEMGGGGRGNGAGEGGQGNGKGNGRSQGGGYGQSHHEGDSVSDLPSKQNHHQAQDRQADPLNPKEPPFVTDKMQAFHDCQLRNLYRIMRRPEAVLEMTSKHNATFMWADVQKFLHRYVDELPLFQKLEAKLKASHELMVLRAENLETGDKAIYTTRTLLQAEKSLIETADRLSHSKTHSAQTRHIEAAIERANEKLKKHGGLSEDQTKAIHHLVDEGQIKCVVGIAGAGKTTALGVSYDIWKAEGYAVYGLAPTGKAENNLEQSGIPSSTLHKFLKSFKEDRCQYNEKSILVLDEAGMVDVERFEELLSAVNYLGVKLIIVGDGAQLQPVEAGPAFRLVTTRLGKVELNSVLRQKEEWQREATVLFGKQDTQAAIQKYMDKGHVHIVEEKLPPLKTLLANEDREGVVKLYEVSTRVSNLMYREMAKDINAAHPGVSNIFPFVKEHQDFETYLEWKGQQRASAQHILDNSDSYRSLLEDRAIDSFKMALCLVKKSQDKALQHKEATTRLKACGLDHLIGMEKEKGQGVDVRQDTKDALIRAWHEGFKKSLEKNFLEDPSLSPHAVMLSFSNRDTNDLNRTARALLKGSGHISKEDFTYTVSKKDEDDFGREHTFTADKNFSKGDRIVFTQNDMGLGVKNGTMGTIMDLNRQKMRVKLDEGEEVSFAPKLNPYFDQGWAVTIHKSQGTTVALTYLLASYEMTRNLAYVAMTRHWKNVQVFASSLDFWRPEKLPEVLSTSGEKLSAADYLDADSLNKLMQKEDQLLTKIFERVSNELDAMGAVSKKAFWQVADHFFGTKREKDIRVNSDSIREEVRAEELLKQKEGRHLESSLSFSQDIKGVQERGHGKEFSQERLQTKTETSQPQKSRPFIEASLVEAALKQNMSAFADDIFSSIGEPYNAVASSSTERRYGKKGHIAVNLRTGVWIDHKDSDRSGGPLHMLTKLKGLSFKEAVEYGASWAGLSEAELSRTGLSGAATERSALKPLAHSSQQDEKAEQAETKAKIDKAQALWNKGQPIQGTIAERYLREHRKIEGSLSEGALLEGTLSENLRYLPSFRDTHSQKSFPCLMAGARSQSGELTAVQITFLNPETAVKADLPVAKRSFGALKGSAVTLQEDSLNADKSSNVLFIAEGVETALSLKSAGTQGTIKASLGLSNIKRILPESPNTHMVICADHDAPDSPAAKSLEKSVQALKEYELLVTVIKPDKLGEDFNDVLKTQGPQGVRDVLIRDLPINLIKIIQYEKDVPSEKTLVEKVFLEKKTVEKSPITLSQKSEEKTFLKEKTASMKKGGVFEELTQQCVKKLYAYLGEERIDLNPDLIKRVEKQAEKAANFIFHAHTLKGTQPTEKETKHFLLRAKYELDRLPEIRDTIIAGWQKANRYKGEKDELIAHMIAERQASIEGRMYLEAKQRGLPPTPTIPDMAGKELKTNRAKTETLAQDLIKKHGLSETAATNCAKDILRYQETHGEKPSDSQMAAMVQISHELDKKTSPSSMDSHNIEYLRRRDGDLQFRELASQGKDLSGFREFPHKEQSYSQPQTWVKPYETQKPARVIEENASDYDLGFSM